MSLDPTQESHCETVITLPDPWATWPWTRRLNPSHARVSAQSSAWIRSYELYSPDQQRVFDLCDHAQLASLAYPDLNEEQLRVTSDYIHLLFGFDDCVERKNKKSAEVMTSAFMNGLKDGATPDLTLQAGVWGAMAQDLWQRLVRMMPNPTYQHRFVSANQRYTEAVVQEADDHHRGKTRNVDEFFELRRGTAALYPLWVLLCMDLDLPEAVLVDQILQEIERVAADMVIVCNDMVSYKAESSRGERHNVIAVLTAAQGLSVQEAMEWAANKGAELMTAAQNAKSRLPRFGGTVDRDLARYVEGLCNWVRACDSWSFDGQRYFGADTPAVRKSRQFVHRERR